MSRPEPIIEYARKIGKNTAEFTVKDLAAFMKWWFKQPVRKDLMEATPAQRKVYHEDVKKVQQYLKGKKMENTNQSEEIVVEMGLTRTDIDALLFCIERTFEDYEMAGHEYEKPLSDLHEGLQEV